MAEGAHRDDRVAKNPQIGTAAHALHQVGRLGVASVMVSEECGGQMSSGTASHNSNPVGIHPPFRGMGPDPTNGPGRILKHRRVAVALATEPVFDHESVHALSVQEQCIISALVACQASVTPSRQNNHGGLSL